MGSAYIILYIVKRLHAEKIKQFRKNILHKSIKNILLKGIS